ncbi:hypothetical protein Krac_1405 [Ktedonobacter racemifer DSM 44963]|uniref:Uncharacterized protein n=2 Tax=Ktedonobacter racemifer TaxID=363277 RepID=D6U1D2_KTERA|nr:hypothetical protein Krac_1405 [Ktedonobacter racemifer DSM 44963]
MVSPPDLYFTTSFKSHYRKMAAMFYFFIGYCGKYMFRIDNQKGNLFNYMDQQAASMGSESGKVLLPFADERGWDKFFCAR